MVKEVIFSGEDTWIFHLNQLMRKYWLAEELRKICGDCKGSQEILYIVFTIAAFFELILWRILRTLQSQLFAMKMMMNCFCGMVDRRKA